MGKGKIGSPGCPRIDAWRPGHSPCPPVSEPYNQLDPEIQAAKSPETRAKENVLTTETIRLRSKGLGAELQLELIIPWSEHEDVAKMVESDLIHDGAIDIDLHVPTHVWDRDQSPIHCQLSKEDSDSSVVIALRNPRILLFFPKLLTVPSLNSSVSHEL